MRLRLWLPISHTLVDLGLLLAAVLLVYRESGQLENPAIWKQNYGPATWGVGEVNVPQPLAAISIGTLPVSIAASLVFPGWS